MSVITLQGLTTGYGSGQRARVVSSRLEGVLRAGEFTVLLGPNGAGKSTLLRTLAGLQPPLQGTVQLDGEDISTLHPRERAKRVGVVLTSHVKVWGLTAVQLVALGRHPFTGWSGTLNARDWAVVQEALSAAGAADLMHRQVAELSDGERQRVMVARALAQEPRVLILDEVTAFLDLPRRVDVMRMLRRLSHAGRHALLLSTHDLDLALRSADRIWLMGRDGTFHTGSPEDIVLSGALQRVFSHEGLDFDSATGAFRLHAETAGRVSLSATGLPAVWTRRAMERLGLDVTSGAQAPRHIDVTSVADAAYVWRLVEGGRSSDHTSIADLVSAIRRDENRDS